MGFGVGDIANSGTMPITGGGATATNGDQRFNAAASFGGLTYNGGVNPYLLGGLALIALVAFVVIKK